MTTDSIVSEVQKGRVKNGLKYQSYILRMARKLSFNILDISRDIRYAPQTPNSYHRFYLDGLFGNWFIEITTSISDLKMIKITETTRLLKEMFPECNVLVLTKKIKNPRKSDGLDSAYDYVNSCPWVDKVCVGEDEFFEFLNTIKDNVSTLNVKNIDTNIKPKESIMSNQPLELIKYLIDQQEVNYATKVLELISGQTSITIASNKVKKSKRKMTPAQIKQEEKRKQLKTKWVNTWKPFNTSKNLKPVSDVFELVNPMSLMNRKEAKLYINSGIFYQNPSGTKNPYVDMDLIHLVPVKIK